MSSKETRWSVLSPCAEQHRAARAWPEALEWGVHDLDVLTH